MSIAREWRGEKRKDVSVSPPRRAIEVGEQISRRVLEATDDGGSDVDRAMGNMADGLRGRRVTFREDVKVHVAPPKGWREPFENLPTTTVAAPARGTMVTVMVDGSTLIELDDRRSVIARIGEDCRLLGRWFRFVDWLRGDRFA